MKGHRFKRHNDRLTYLLAGGRQALTAWLAVRAMSEGPAHPSRQQGRGSDGAADVRAITVADARSKRAVEAGLRSFTSHDLLGAS